MDDQSETATGASKNETVVDLASTWQWDRLAIIAMTMVGAIVGIAALLGYAPLPGDAQAYWLASPAHPYTSLGYYVFPPALAQLLEPVRWAGSQVFVIGWTALCFGSIGYVLGRWSAVAVALAFVATRIPGPWSEPVASAFMGNVTSIMVAAMVAGVRHPALWAVPLLTKMTVGVGVLWFAFRGEWRSFALALSVTAGIAAVLFVISPSAWTDFAAFALANLGATSNGPPIVGPPLGIRLPIAVALVWWGARTNRAWLLPIAGATALIGLYGVGSLVAVAVGALKTATPVERRADDAGAPV